MSYYGSARKYRMTHHALRRAKERLNLKDVPEYKIHEILEEYLENAIFLDYQGNNCVIMKNFQHNITIILDEEKKIIKTVY